MMFGNQTILYWFRDPQWNPDKFHFDISFNECARFVPIYCFDPREEQFFNQSSDYLRYWNETVDRVEALRAGLQSKGSNLLIVNGSYEVIVPSLARVLNADEVVAKIEMQPANLLSSNLAEFRKSKTFEIQYNLKMHSISMKIQKNYKTKQAEFPGTFFLPPFPEINPGIVPARPLV